MTRALPYVDRISHVSFFKHVTLVTPPPPIEQSKNFSGLKNNPLDICITHMIKPLIMSVFHTKFIAPAEFDLEMLKALHLGADPYVTAAKYHFDYDLIKDLPHFQTRMEQVEQALLLDGTLTPVIAGVGLHAAVEKLAFRVQDDRISTGDLVKAIETLKKVKDGSKSQEPQSGQAGVSLVINIPAFNGAPAKTIEVTTPGSSELQEYNTHEAETIELDRSDFRIELPE